PEAAGLGEEQGHGCIGDVGAVQALQVGDADVALDEFGDEVLLDAGVADLNPAHLRVRLDDVGGAETDYRVGAGGFLGGFLDRLHGNEEYVRRHDLQVAQPRRHQRWYDDLLRRRPAAVFLRRRRAFVDAEIFDEVPWHDAAGQLVVNVARLCLALAGFYFGPFLV